MLLFFFQALSLSSPSPSPSPVARSSVLDPNWLSISPPDWEINFPLLHVLKILPPSAHWARFLGLAQIIGKRGSFVLSP